ncbi:MAG: cation:proton antiporter [Flavobacteriaceae bacterium]
MDPLWILLAFFLGFTVYRVGLPPLVGYLIAGFVLQSFGVVGGPALDEVADLGVMLLLFTIGLKLNLRSLLKPEIWAGASVHMLITILIFGIVIFGVSLTGISVFQSLDLTLSILLAFALSFSSTVFAVKVFENKGELSSLHGRVSIGILIMQDIFAVLFLTVSLGKIPSPWAIALIAALLLGRPLLHALLSRVGHRELLLLFGMFLALGLGAGGFDLVGLKPDLGALVMGILLTGHPKATEMSDVLLSFKDLFLVGFFLQIGLSGAPSLEALGIGALISVAVILKIFLFFYLLTRFKLRARTSLLAALGLATYSEFGLLVTSIGVEKEWIGVEWLTIMAIAVSISFIVASPFNASSHSIYDRWGEKLRRFQSKKRRRDDQPVDPGGARIVIFGMGRIGTVSYDILSKRHGDIILGVDKKPEHVQKHLEEGRNAIQGDATDIDFWIRIRSISNMNVQMILLTMPHHVANMQAISELKKTGYTGIIAATAKFDDQVEELKAAGVQIAYNFYTEVGYGFSHHVSKVWEGDKLFQ